MLKSPLSLVKWLDWLAARPVATKASSHNQQGGTIGCREPPNLNQDKYDVFVFSAPLVPSSQPAGRCGRPLIPTKLRSAACQGRLLASIPSQAVN